MSGPHHLVSAARHALRAAFTDLEIGAPVVLAVSGGADSLALALSAQYAAREKLLDLCCVIVDHQIRAESGAEAAFVAQQLNARGLTVQVVPLATALPQAQTQQNSDVLTQTQTQQKVGAAPEVQAKITHEGPEGAARRGRYLALAQVARALAAAKGQTQPAPVFLGHNADDQAESVVLGFGRGSGARSIAGMPRVGKLPICPDVPMRRPLLDFTHAQLQQICEELGIEYVEDPSNQLDGPWRTAAGTPLRRARVRHEVLPLLEDVLAGGVVGALGRTAQLLQEDSAALDHYTDLAWEECVSFASAAARDTTAQNLTPSAAAISENLQETKLAAVALPAFKTYPRKPNKIALIVNCVALRAYPRAIRTRLLRKVFLASGGRGGELVFWHLDRLDRLIQTRENNLRLDLPGVTVGKKHQLLRFTSRN